MRARNPHRVDDLTILPNADGHKPSIRRLSNGDLWCDKCGRGVTYRTLAQKEGMSIVVPVHYGFVFIDVAS